MSCNATGCNNAGRYDSGYCGIHDIEFNAGAGKLVPQKVCASCGVKLGKRYWSDVPGVGDLCPECHDERF